MSANQRKTAEEGSRHCIGFSFQVGGYFDGYKTLVFEEQDAFVQIVGTHTFQDPEAAPMSGRITLGEWKSIKERLFHRLLILSWKEEYSNPYVLDGTQWELTLRFDDRPDRTMTGSNQYPPSYDKLVGLVNPYLNLLGMEPEQ